MNTLNFLDSNVWLALIWSRHIHSERAGSWFAGAAEEQFFFCRFTQLTVLRLLTTESVMAKETKTMPEAWPLWDRVWADPAGWVWQLPAVVYTGEVRVLDCAAGRGIGIPKFSTGPAN